MYSEPSIPVPLRIPRMASPLHLFLHDDRDRVVSHRIRAQGLWEPYETALVLDLLGPGGVFVDVGANIGYFSIVGASAVGDSGVVFAFEPDPDNFRLLQANAGLNGLQGRIDAVQAGLAATNHTGRLYLSRDNFGDHRLSTAVPGRESVEVQLLHGGEYLGSRLVRIDLLKVDTQGSEYDVMLGLMPLLRRLPEAPRILIELTPLSLRQSGASGRALVELLATLGLPLWIVDHIEYRLAPHSVEQLAQWCDAVDAVDGDEGFMNILVGHAPDHLHSAPT